MNKTIRTLSIFAIILTGATLSSAAVVLVPEAHAAPLAHVLPPQAGCHEQAVFGSPGKVIGECASGAPHPPP